MDANAPGRQVGGDHYKSKYMHWDMAADLELLYFEGQITKYIVRHRQKEGLKDVQKCRHFIEKLIELVVEGRACPGDAKLGSPFVDLFLVERLKVGTPPLTRDEVTVFEKALSWNGTGHLEDALEACKRVEAGYP